MAILLVGAPGSGKTTWGKHYAESRDIVRLCPDEFRAKFGTGEDDQSVSAQAFGATRAAMANLLIAGQSVMIDATNMYRKARKDFVRLAREAGVKTMAVVFELPKNVLLERNKKRGEAGGRNVSEEVIDDMLDRYQRPEEGTEFDAVLFISKA